MQVPEFERMLAAMLEGEGSASVTLTEAPGQESVMRQLLDAAVLSGRRRGRVLSRVELPSLRFPGMGDSYSQFAVADSGSADVVRLFFDA